jgi:hypothetical protein
MERTFAWLGNHRRLVVRYNYHFLMLSSLLSSRLSAHHPSILMKLLL